MTKTVYKIRHRNTGLYSMGGASVSLDGVAGRGWSKEGKTWTSLGKVKQHLLQYGETLWGRDEWGAYVKVGTKWHLPPTWVVVEFEIVEKPKAIPVLDLMNAHNGG